MFDLKKYMTQEEVAAWVAEQFDREDVVEVAQDAAGVWWTATREFTLKVVPEQIREQVAADLPQWADLDGSDKLFFMNESTTATQMMIIIAQTIANGQGVGS